MPNNPPPRPTTPDDARAAAGKLLAWWFGHPGAAVKPDPFDIYLAAAYARDAAGTVAELEARLARALGELADAKRLLDKLGQRCEEQSALLSRFAEKGAVSPAGNVIFDPKPRE